MIDGDGAGESLNLVMPVSLTAKARVRKPKPSGKTRSRRSIRRLLPELMPLRDGRTRRCVRPLRDGYNPEDFKIAREIVERFCPARVPYKMRRYLKGPFDLFEALMIYVLVVEFGWGQAEMAGAIGRCRHVQNNALRIVEDMRDQFEFIERISERAQEHRHGLL